MIFGLRQVLPGQALPPGIREQLNGPVTLPSLYLQKAVKSFQVPPAALLAALLHMLDVVEPQLECAQVRAARLLPATLGRLSALNTCLWIELLGGMTV